MIKLKQTSPENVWYDFEDEVDFSQYEDKMVIAGNGSFKEFGDSDLIKIVSNLIFLSILMPYNSISLFFIFFFIFIHK